MCKRFFTNTDYEEYSIQRDKAIESLLKAHNATFHAYKDHVIFHKNEVLRNNNEPYTIFTPYSKRWLEKLNTFYLKSYPTKKYHNNFYRQSFQPIPFLSSIGFKPVNKPFPSKILQQQILQQYELMRDFPGREGTSKLSVHLRFGTISIRQVAAQAQHVSNVF